MQMPENTYLDYAAATPLDPRVHEEVARYWGRPLNPSSIHRSGQRARAILDGCRERLAAALGTTHPEHLVFTSGATEAANLAIRGLVDAASGPVRVLSSPIEHSCVRGTLARLAAQGRIELELLGVTEDGRARFPERISADTRLLCLMHSNNETGVIQDIASARERGKALWLCDAAQSLGKTRLNLGELGADLVVLSAHKVYGPVGAGCLAGPAVVQLAPQTTGGLQEGELRAGTQAVALIAGFVKAAELAVAELDARRAHLASLEEQFLEALRASEVSFRRNGGGESLPGFLNLSFEGFSAADLVIALDQRGFEVSAGAACATGVAEVSPVLAAMFPNDPGRAGGGIRITFGAPTTAGDAVRLARALSEIMRPGIEGTSR